MLYRVHQRFCIVLLSLIAVSGCASTSALVAHPSVNLTSLELINASFERQTFHLGFAVENSNSFPLPVRAVEYDVFLDDEKFASGATQGTFTVPANGSDEFMISVELDFLNSAAHMSSLMRTGLPDSVDYQLQGKFTVDIPFARPLPFSSSGTIRMQ